MTTAVCPFPPHRSNLLLASRYFKDFPGVFFIHRGWTSETGIFKWKNHHHQRHHDRSGTFLLQDEVERKSCLRDGNDEGDDDRPLEQNFK